MSLPEVIDEAFLLMILDQQHRDPQQVLGVAGSPCGCPIAELLRAAFNCPVAVEQGVFFALGQPKATVTDGAYWDKPFVVYRPVSVVIDAVIAWIDRAPEGKPVTVERFYRVLQSIHA